MVDVISYTPSLVASVTQWGRRKPYARNVSTVGDDGYICASFTVYGLSDGLGERNLVHGDYLDVAGYRGGRTGGGGVGARLDRTARIDGGELGSVIQGVRVNEGCSAKGVGWEITDMAVAQAMMLARAER